LDKLQVVVEGCPEVAQHLLPARIARCRRGCSSVGKAANRMTRANRYVACGQRTRGKSPPECTFAFDTCWILAAGY